MTLDQARARYASGAMAEQDFRWYMFIWCWAAPRFSGPAARAQDRCYAKLGYDALLRRRQRVFRIGQSKGFIPITAEPHS